MSSTMRKVEKSFKTVWMANPGEGVFFTVLTVALLVASCDSSSPTSSDQAPSVSFTASAGEEDPMAYHFDASESSAVNGGIETYDWEFGDGETGSGQTVSHTYDEVGEKDVTLTITDEDGNTGSSTETISVAQSYDYSSEYAYNLNIIYFTPTDVDPLPDYRSRLSGFLLYIQDYYRQWMEEWGHGEKNFGLLKDQEGQMVKITRVEGEGPVSDYPNDGGGRAVREEVREYFENADEEPDSKHYLVFMPKPDDLDASLPYYAIGRWGFVTDIGQNGEKAPNEGGGVAHELGHAINLPHNAHRRTHEQDFGTALMNDGNNVWNNQGGAQATSLTEASAEIVNVSQVMSRTEGSFYGDVDTKLLASKGRAENGNIKISGVFDTDTPVNKAVVVLDPEGRGTYNQIGIMRPVMEADSFHASIPTSELYKTQNAEYEAKVWLVHENGYRANLQLPDFAFEDGEPNIDFGYPEVNTLPKENWELVDFSDEEVENDKLAEYIIDGYFGTHWHSRYTPERVDHPHSFTVDMGKLLNVDGFQFVQRIAGNREGGTRLKDLDLEVSDDGENWETLGEYTLENMRDPQVIELPNTKKFRYFKITTRSSHGGYGSLATLAEVGVF